MESKLEFGKDRMPFFWSQPTHFRKMLKGGEWFDILAANQAHLAQNSRHRHAWWTHHLIWIWKVDGRFQTGMFGKTLRLLFRGENWKHVHQSIDLQNSSRSWKSKVRGRDSYLYTFLYIHKYVYACIIMCIQICIYIYVHVAICIDVYNYQCVYNI